MKKYVFFLLACSMLATSCEQDLIKGEGPVLTENRDTPVFTQVRSNGSAKVYIDYADTLSVQVKGYANLIPHFGTDVIEGVLHLSFKDQVRVKKDNIEVYITMPAVEGLAINGSGEFRLSGAFPFLPLLNLEVNGSGNIRTAEAEAGELKARISGSGSMKLEELKAETADISISGSGNVRVQVSRQLNVRISGSGNVYYRGNPGISSEISGSGNVIKF